MVHITLTYGVEDYDTWKNGFNTHADARQSAGCLSTTVRVSPDNRNQLLILFEWDSKENFMKYSSDPALKEAMAKSGLTGPPTIKFWDLHKD